MSKYTKGPWQADICTSDATCDLVYSKHGNGCLVAEISKCNQQTEENAHLIAAAPELLEILEMIEDKISENLSMWIPEGKKITCGNIIKTVIKKARGETFRVYAGVRNVGRIEKIKDES